MQTVTPLSYILKGTFPQGLVVGRTCLLLDVNDDGYFDSDGHQLVMFHILTPLISLLMTQYLNWKVKVFLSQTCPKKKMSSIGVYKRNVLTFKETKILLYVTCFTSAVLGAVLQTLLKIKSEGLSKEARFWIWNLKGFLVNDCFYMCLPLFLRVPIHVEVKTITSQFYVSKPANLQPRRHTFLKNSLTEHNAHERETEIKRKVFPCTKYCRKHGSITCSS